MRDMFQLRRFAESLSAMWTNYEKGDHGQVIQDVRDRFVDHDIPFSKGGSSLTPADVRLVCAKCNLQNGVDGISDIEGKVARVAASEFKSDKILQKRAEIGQSLGGIKESESRRLLVTENAARGEPVAHRGVFGRRGRAPFGEFLALFRQQFH